MHRPLVRSALAAALLLLPDGLAAQAADPPRALLVPQVGAAVHQSRSSQMTSMASLAVELPVGHGVSLMAEGTAALTDHLLTVCWDSAVCAAPTGIRSGATAGVVVRPFQLGRLAPYAGVSAGVARWARADFRGTGPLASLRAGVDARITGPFGVRADLVRRILWSDEADFSPVYADVLSVGASFALRR